MRKLAFVLLFCLVISLTGCTTTQKGAVIGATGGAVAGGAIGYFAGDSQTDDAVKGAAIGAVTGALAGALLGYFAGE